MLEYWFFTVLIKLLLTNKNGNNNNLYNNRSINYFSDLS